MLYAGRTVSGRNGGSGVVVGWNDMRGVILGVGHTDGWQSWGANDIGVSEDEFPSYEYRDAGMLEEPPGMPGPADPGDGPENVSSKTMEEKVWKH